MNINEIVYAPMVEVKSAVELMLDTYALEKNTMKFYNLDTMMSLINMCCIEESDRVLVMYSEIDFITWIIAYLYTPKKIVSNRISLQEEHQDYRVIIEEKFQEISTLLNGYRYTKPDLLNEYTENVQAYEECYEVLVANFFNAEEVEEENIHQRFRIETGLEYDRFKRNLSYSGCMLKKHGRLIILAKPSWILSSWELLQELGLQLEYQQYSIYMENKNHPNAYVWLRFVKLEKDFNTEKQRRNVASLMKDNNIDRLYAHRNNLRFPYVELSYENSQVYVQLDQNLEYMQYFFSVETTKMLGGLCEGYTACLTTPSIAQYAHKSNKNVVLFERDNRFRENRGVKFVKYDLKTGLTKFTQRKYAEKFDRVICDPPFDISLEVLAKDIMELIKKTDNRRVYIVYPTNRKTSLINAMRNKGLTLIEDEENITIEYGKPPKLVRVHGKDAIKLFSFK